MSKMDRREIEAQESARVLLVDDDPGLRNMIGILLEKMGLQCTATESSEEAMLCLENQGYELVIVDKNLPGLSGLQLARIIHLLSPKTPILLITGYASEETAREAAALGISEYILKPIDIDDFRRTVNTAVRHTSSRPGRSAKRFRSTFPPGTTPAVVARLSKPPKIEMQDDDTPSVELLRGVAVLLIERDDNVRLRLVEILSLTGSQIVSFTSVNQARAHVERQGFDLLIARHGVLAAARNLIERAPKPPLGTIAIMQHGGLDEVIDAIRLQARGVLSPPFVTTNVMLELGRVMKGLADERTARACAS